MAVRIECAKQNNPRMKQKFRAVYTMKKMLNQPSFFLIFLVFTIDGKNVAWRNGRVQVLLETILFGAIIYQTEIKKYGLIKEFLVNK